MKTKFSLTLIHEVNKQGEHRIVAVASDGTNSTGEWVAAHQLASHLDVFANADPDNGLPLGCFKVKEVAHQVLNQ